MLELATAPMINQITHFLTARAKNAGENRLHIHQKGSGSINNEDFVKNKTEL
jgi:hypothetical protein